MELARLAVDSGGDPAAIQMWLDPTMYPELNLYIAFLFETIIARSPLVGFSVSLSRYDLFHGHLFLAADSGRLGILFHSREYPAYEKNTFPYHMGYCQTGSNVRNFRNILWLAPLPYQSRFSSWVAPGVLVVLDAHPGGIIYKELVSDYVDYVRTIYEGDFGDVAVDVYYLNVENAATEDKIFICSLSPRRHNLYQYHVELDIIFRPLYLYFFESLSSNRRGGNTFKTSNNLLLQAFFSSFLIVHNLLQKVGQSNAWHSWESTSCRDLNKRMT